MPHNGSETSSTQGISPEATLTSGASLTCEPTTSAATSNATSSPGLAVGAAPSDLLNGPTITPSGPAPARVSRFRALDNERAMPTNDTSGPLFTASSPSAPLQSFLENRLRARMAANGSPEYVLTWKQLDMPAGLPICALRARGRHKSDSACTGWPTVRASDRGPRNHETAKRKLNEDGRTIHHRIEDLLTALATSTGYPNPTFLSWLMGFPEFWIKFAPSVTPSTRRSRQSSSPHIGNADHED